MPKTCPYHGNQQPCRKCLEDRRGEFAFYKSKPGMCPYHGKPSPCLTCFDNRQGEFAHLGSVASAEKYVAPAFRPPAKKMVMQEEIVHIHQPTSDSCAVACCTMVGAFLHCPREFSYEELEAYMIEKGIYLPGDKSLFHALDRAIEWLGLKCKMALIQSPKDMLDYLHQGNVLILEALGHVLVIFGANPNGTLIVGDPAMHSVKYDIELTDYRLKGSRIWVILNPEH